MQIATMTELFPDGSGIDQVQGMNLAFWEPEVNRG